MDINNLDKVARLRDELKENHDIGEGILALGVDVSVGGKMLDIPEALAQSIEDLIVAHYAREYKDLNEELAELGVDGTTLETGADAVQCDCPACQPGGEGRIPSTEEALARMFGAPKAGRSVQAIPLTAEALAKIFGADLAAKFTPKRIF